MYRRELNVSTTRKLNAKMNDILNPLNHRGENYDEMGVDEMRDRLREWASRNPASGYYQPMTHTEAVHEWQQGKESKQLEIPLSYPERLDSSLFPPTP